MKAKTKVIACLIIAAVAVIGSVIGIDRRELVISYVIKPIINYLGLRFRPEIASMIINAGLVVAFAVFILAIYTALKAILLSIRKALSAG